jgi:hypothetical protein
VAQSIQIGAPGEQNSQVEQDNPGKQTQGQVEGKTSAPARAGKQLTDPKSALATLRATHWRSGLVALLAIIALAGCAEGAILPGQAGYSPYSSERSGDMRGGSDGGGSGGGGGM